MINFFKLLFNSYQILSPLIHTQPPSGSQKSEPKCHAQAIPDNIQFASLDLLPANGYLNHWDVGTFCQHEHLYVENPALGVHVRNDVRQRRAREQLETTLSVFDLCCFRGGKKA